jgi:ribosome-associated protein
VESREIANRITEILDDRQGEDILVLDLTEVTTFADFFVICTANSRRQLDALQSAIREEMKKAEVQRLAETAEGDSESGWVLIDYNSVIVHLFTAEMRDYYRLEELWGSARTVAHIQ